MLRLTKEDVQYALNHIAILAKENHWTQAELDREEADGFYYRDALENEGFYVIPAGYIQHGEYQPNVAFDFGDTLSGGESLENVDPTASIPEFTQALKVALEKLLPQTRLANQSQNKKEG